MRNRPTLAPLALVIPLAAGCIQETRPLPPASKPASSPASAPARIKVAHVLIAFKGSGIPTVLRSKEEAETLAKQILEKARKGLDFDALMKQSDDTGGGKYGMYMNPAAAKPGDMRRADMVAAFGDVGFTLQVGEIGMAPFDSKKSPYGWHIIKRIE
jgi:parvulin-like peptidyl-prolyl cis-trans isomerase-like protein